MKRAGTVVRMAAGLCAVLVVMVLGTGCATPPTPIPAAYFGGDHTMSVAVTRCPPKAQMMDSGQGGLIGAMVTAGRGANMQKKLEGIKGATVSELMRQQIAGSMEDYFDVSNENHDLATEITVRNWGWFVPTAALGIKTGSYQCRVMGVVDVYDLKANRKRIGHANIFAQEPLGNDPQNDVAQEALVKALQACSTQATGVLLGNKPAE